MEGFWDGYIFTLGHARLILRTIFIGVSLPAGVWFCFLAWNRSEDPAKKRLQRSVLLYGFVIVVLACVYSYARLHLNDGGWPDDTENAPGWLEWFAKHYPSGRGRKGLF